MEVVDPRSALLSNFEVLALLRELEGEHLAKAKANFLVKKEQLDASTSAATAASASNPTAAAVSGSGLAPVPTAASAASNATLAYEEETAENLRTVVFETIKYLEQPQIPTTRQTLQGVQKLTKSLSKFELTKAEKLQIVNLAPVEVVELYVIIEELEDRLTEEGSMGEILSLVQSNISIAPVPASSIPSADVTSLQLLPSDGLTIVPKREDLDSVALAIDPDADNEDDYGYNDYIDDGIDMVADNEAGGFEGDLDVADDED